MNSSKRTADEVFGEQPAVKVQKSKIEQAEGQPVVKIEQDVENVSKILMDCVAKIYDCMERHECDEILKIINEVMPSDELVNSLVTDKNPVMRTGNVVNTGIPRDQRIKNAHALLDKALQLYEESNEDAPPKLIADVFVFIFVIINHSLGYEVAKFFRKFIQDLNVNILSLCDAGVEDFKGIINHPAGMNICQDIVRLFIKINDPSNKLEFAKAAQTVLKEVRNNYETYSRDITMIIDYYLVIIVVLKKQ